MNTDKKVKKTMKIKPVKKKKLALKSLKHNINKKVEQVDQVVNSTDTEIEDEVSTIDDYTEETDRKSSETESGEIRKLLLNFRGECQIYTLT